MRVRFLKTKEYVGIKTVIFDSLINVEDCRFFVEFGKILEVKDYILGNGQSVDIIMNDDSIYKVPVSDVELSEPSSYKPSGVCCNQ